MLAARHDRMERVRDFLAALTAEQLDGEVDSPNGGSATVRQCLKVVFNEEGWHDHHARRDLAVLARRAEQPS